MHSEKCCQQCSEKGALYEVLAVQHLSFILPSQYLNRHACIRAYKLYYYVTTKIRMYVLLHAGP